MKKISRNNLRIQRKKRIRAKISGDATTPRFSIFKSLQDVKVQVIDDVRGVTLVSGSLKDAKAKDDVTGAKMLGEFVGKKCLEKKIATVVFDRSGYKYHGKIKALADGAREAGLKF